MERKGRLPGLSGKGEVFSWTIIYDAPYGYQEFAPYVVAWVQLEEGPLVTAMLTDINIHDVEMGMKVEVVTRVLRKDGNKGLIVYGNKFRPEMKGQN